MTASTHNSTLATRLAALQQGMALPFPVGSLSASRLMGASPPTPLPAGSLALREDNKQVTERAAILIGASKSQPAELLEEAITLGLADFGENKVQEAQSKWPKLLARHPHVRLHLIGPLQSNKAADAVALFDVIHSIDRVKIADALAKALEQVRVASHGEPEGGGAQRGRDAPTRTVFAHPKFLIQVNTGEEPQKAGVSPRETATLLAHCQKLGLNVVGLMCVPPEGENPAPHFALLKKMADELGLPELSMGMSGDYHTALRLGATMIRVGTALFGAR